MYIWYYVGFERCKTLGSFGIFPPNLNCGFIGTIFCGTKKNPRLDPTQWKGVHDFMNLFHVLFGVVFGSSKYIVGNRILRVPLYLWYIVRKNGYIKIHTCRAKQTFKHLKGVLANQTNLKIFLDGRAKKLLPVPTHTCREKLFSFSSISLSWPTKRIL